MPSKINLKKYKRKYSNLKQSEGEKGFCKMPSYSYNDYLIQNGSKLYPYKWDHDIKVFLQTF